MAPNDPSMPHEVCVDRLSTLPPELLEMIFDQLSLEEPEAVRALRAGLSRTLRSVTTRCLYRRLHFNRLPQIRQLCETFTTGDRLRRKFLAGLVESFKMSRHWHSDSDDRALMQMYAEIVLRLLQNLKVVDVTGFPYLSALLLNEEFSSTSIQRLEIMAFGFTGQIGRFNFGALGNYRHLEEVQIDWHDESGGWRHFYKHCQQIDDSPLPTNNYCHFHVQSLQIRFGSHIHLATVNEFFEKFPKVQSYRFLDVPDTMDLHSLLGSCGREFEHLTVWQITTSRPSNVPETELLQLSLDGDPKVDDQSLSIICRLQQLKKLTLYPICTLRGDQLLQLVDRTTGPPSLKEIELRATWQDERGCIGEDLRNPSSESEEKLALAKYGEEAELLDYGWERPDWYGAFTCEEMKAILSTAEKAGIKVSGDILRDMEMQKACDAMQDYLNMRNGWMVWPLPTKEERVALDRYWKRWFNGELGKRSSSQASDSLVT